MYILKQCGTQEIMEQAKGITTTHTNNWSSVIENVVGYLLEFEGNPQIPTSTVEAND